jgi:hypothetical protein
MDIGKDRQHFFLCSDRLLVAQFNMAPFDELKHFLKADMIRRGESRNWIFVKKKFLQEGFAHLVGTFYHVPCAFPLLIQAACVSGVGE